MKLLKYLVAYSLLSFSALAFAFPQIDVAKEKSTSDKSKEKSKAPQKAKPMPAKTQPKKKAGPASKTQDAAVGKALQKVDYIMNGKASPNAKYYILLYSASWCGPCRAEMPHIVKIYAEKISKDPNVELVLISGDRDENAAKTWAEKENATFPIAAGSSYSKIPGASSPAYYPYMRLVKADGTLITDGHGSKVMQYESLIKKD